MPWTAGKTRSARPATDAARPGRPYPREFLAAMTDHQALKLAESEGIADSLESDMRLWAFHVAYNRLYADVLDCCLRFGLALVASIRPVRQQGPARQWLARRARTVLARSPSTAPDEDPFV